ncbi:MAG: hypothetical protein ACFNMC_01920 [Veillonella parvula]
MNQFTIEFKNAKDLAKKIAEYNELMNPKSIKELAVKVVEEPKKEVEAEPKQETTLKVVEEPQPERIEAEEPNEEVVEVPVTNFEGEPVAIKAEEVEEPTETELDVETAEIDPQVYWNDFKDWLKHVGAEGVKAALDVFRNHGVNGKPNSGDLTPEIMQELNALMGK